MQESAKKRLVFSIKIEDGHSEDDKRTIRVPLSVPADDFPTAVKTRYDVASTTLILEFDYSPSEEKRISEDLESYEFIHGERTGRIYQVSVRIPELADHATYDAATESIEKMSKDRPEDSPPRVAKNLHLGSLMLERLGPKLRQGLAVS